MTRAIGNTLKSQSGPVLITGHTGFKGVWLTILLETLGVKVVGYSLPAKNDSLFKMMNRQGKIEEKFADITAFSQLQNFISITKPCAIIHLAAQALVLESYNQPLETFNTNVMGTANLLEAAFAVESVKVVAAITTDKVYQNKNLGRKFCETDPLEGKDPYSASKVGSEAAISAWQQIQKLSGGPKVLSLRAGNVIGGGDLATNRLIPDLVRAFQNRTCVTIRSPKSTRPWQHVLDPLIGYVIAVEKSFSEIKFESYNFGPTEKSLQVLDVVGIFKEEIGSGVEIVIEEVIEEVESKTLDLDSSRAIQHLGWLPLCEQTEAIAITFGWWDAVLVSGKDPEEVTKKDINEMLTRLNLRKLDH
jgi:CDP-glucose 4,6-dehydratase